MRQIEGMQKDMNKPKARTKTRDDVANIIADLMGVTPDYVRKVRRGDREDEEIFSMIMELQEGKNQLIETVKQLVPLSRTTA